MLLAHVSSSEIVFETSIGHKYRTSGVLLRKALSGTENDESMSIELPDVIIEAV